MLSHFQQLGCYMSIKIHLLRIHLDRFPENLDDLSEEQEEGFHQDIQTGRASGVPGQSRVESPPGGAGGARVGAGGRRPVDRYAAVNSGGRHGNAAHPATTRPRRFRRRRAAPLRRRPRD
ncbi:hypothetical protein EVAR_19368_1 [Eumeta japonica]|uniref:Uncharacterized protein n=1 Tax=Eumeta variegata TaxID=151549 RepID=A0A4C1TRF0_EUMVA|nr:hypothetical protein EVAR_19368_1 [Eumeta japonica]